MPDTERYGTFQADWTPQHLEDLLQVLKAAAELKYIDDLAISKIIREAELRARK